MKKVAVIGEFNPLHNGHKYLFESIKRAIPDSIIYAIMSGDFNQRGIPAIINKWKRAEIAVMSGSDAVFELPLPYSLSPAKEFARGGIRIAEELGADILAFGSEIGDIDILKKCAEISMNFNENNPVFLEGKKLGKSFSKTLIEILSREIPEYSLGSNDILAVEYIKALKDTEISPMCFKREECENYLSASQLRNRIKNGDLNDIREYFPEVSFSILKTGGKYVFFDDFSKEILYLMTLSSKEDLMKINGANEELVNILIKARKMTSDIENLIEISSSKNYSKSRIRRYLLNLLLNITKGDADEIKKEAPSLRLLCGNTRGLSLIKDRKIISKFKNHTSKALKLSKRASDIYNLKLKGDINTDYTTSPIIIK